MRQRLRSLHRAVSLAFLLFWLIQAVSGAFLVFHREIDAAAFSGAADAPLDLDAIDARIAALEAEGRVSGLFAVTGYSRLYDVHVERPSGDVEVVRIDGAGRVLQRRPLEGGIYLAINRLHRNLLAGPAGAWLLSVSGVLLVSNLLLGLKLAWPAGGQWRKAMFPPRARAAPARLYGWHRALGLWLVPLALVTLTCGVALHFERGLSQLIGASGDSPPPGGSAAVTVRNSPMTAVQAALDVYPGAVFTGVQIPAPQRALYTVFLRQPAEPGQAHGATRVFVHAGDATVAGAYDPLRARWPDRLLSLLYPVHTGQAGGVPGRIVVLALAIWLVTMIVLGVSLWSARRGPRPAGSRARKEERTCTGEP